MAWLAIISVLILEEDPELSSIEDNLLSTIVVALLLGVLSVLCHENVISFLESKMIAR
jgi:hypothetical protein